MCTLVFCFFGSIKLKIGLQVLYVLQKKTRHITCPKHCIRFFEV